MATYCIEIDGLETIESLGAGSVGNLLLNMAGGLRPEDLSAREERLLKNEYGPNWRSVLGYEKPEAGSKAVVGTIYVPFAEPVKYTPLRKPKRKGTCIGKCGRDGYIYPAGVFDNSQKYCDVCYNAKFGTGK